MKQQQHPRKLSTSAFISCYSIHINQIQLDLTLNKIILDVDLTLYKQQLPAATATAAAVTAAVAVDFIRCQVNQHPRELQLNCVRLLAAGLAVGLFR